VNRLRRGEKESENGREKDGEREGDIEGEGVEGGSE
jgi:hypothetical protein